MSTRYEDLFHSLHNRGEGAFVPFLMLGDPTPEHTLAIVRTVVAAGADALELGVPFSDPVADGPTIQASHLRALDGGATVDSALEQVRTIRAGYPELPIGMLIYGNVAFTRGFDRFYAEFAEAGADSILLPDVPVREGAPFIAAAKKPVLIQYLSPRPARLRTPSRASLKAHAAISTQYHEMESRVPKRNLRLLGSKMSSPTSIDSTGLQYC